MADQRDTPSDTPSVGGPDIPGSLDIIEIPVESKCKPIEKDTRQRPIDKEGRWQQPADEGKTQQRPIGEDVMRKQPVDSKGSRNDTSSPSKLWTRDFFVITLVNFLLFCGFQLFPSSLPLYMKELGAPDSILGWVTGITTIAALLIRPFSGAILDRFGRKGIFLFSLIMMVGVSLSFAFFPIIGAILLIRFIHGIGWGISSTATSTIASDIIPRKRFGEGMGYYSLSGSLALALAPGIGIALFQSVGMQTISFLATGILVCALLLAITVRTQPIPRAEPNLKKKRVHLIERTSVFPSIVVFFITATYGAIVTFVAVFAESRSVEGIGLFFTMHAVALLLSRPFAGRIVDSKGTSALIAPGLILLIGAMVLLAFSDSLVLFVTSAGIYGIGFGALQSSLQTLAIASAPIEHRGAANATFFTGFDAGIGFGSIASGLVVSAIGYSSMYLLFVLFPLIGTAIFAFHQRKKNKDAVSRHGSL